jgi:hypothetical protein
MLAWGLVHDALLDTFRIRADKVELEATESGNL